VLTKWVPWWKYFACPNSNYSTKTSIAITGNMLAAMLFRTQAWWGMCGVTLEPLDGNPATWGPSGKWTNSVLTPSYTCVRSPKGAEDWKPCGLLFQDKVARHKVSGFNNAWFSNYSTLSHYTLNGNTFVPTFRKIVLHPYSGWLNLVLVDEKVKGWGMCWM
jgi:hypothetical protein